MSGFIVERGVARQSEMFDRHASVALAKREDLIRRQLPSPTQTSKLRAIWHDRDEHDAGHTWPRAMLANAANVTEKAMA